MNTVGSLVVVGEGGVMLDGIEVQPGGTVCSFFFPFLFIIFVLYFEIKG